MMRFTKLADVANPSALLEKAKLYHNHFSETPGGQEVEELLKLGQKKTMVLLFFNPSLRTRLSTEKAGHRFGLQVISMDAGQGWKLEFEDGIVMNTDKAEHIREAAAVISQYADIIGIRTFPGLEDREKDYQETVLENFIQYATVPVISLESGTRHPLQSLTDWLTIETHKTVARPKVVLTWAPHPRALPQAVSNSFAEWMSVADVDLTITHPEGYELAPEFTQHAKVMHDQEAAFKDADFIYAKNWSSYGDYGKILNTANDWMIDERKMALTNDAKFMHCLPVRRNVVVSDGVLDSPNSLVIPQSRNRTFAAMAVIGEMLNQNK